ncbi:MAG TPA: outer membrane protein transport protein [Prolixibacteraceae bacterium]|jgi:long-chain fatty acid transport protein
MRNNYFNQLAALVILLICTTQISFATDGYFSLGYGTRSKGMAGAGVAMYSSSLIGGNPAGNVFLGNEFAIGIAAFSPNRAYTISENTNGQQGIFPLTPGTVKSDKPVFFIPSVGGNWMINKSSAIGFSIYGNGGMNTSYPTKTFNNPMAPVTSPTGINLSQLFSEISYSVKIAKNHSIGISAIGAFQMFEAEGLQAFMGMTLSPDKLTNNGLDNSFGFGGKIGYLGKLTDHLSLGLKYQSKIFMSEFKEYAGLFAQQGDFDIPSNWTVGLAYQFSRSFTLAFDVKQIRYTDVKAVSNPLTLDYFLGEDKGPGFAWQNLMIFKLGMEYASKNDWIWRAGYSYGLQNIPESQLMFNILAPAVSQNHVAVGFTRTLSKKNNALDLSLMYSPENSLSGPNSLDPSQTIELKMSQFELELGYSF